MSDQIVTDHASSLLPDDLGGLNYVDTTLHPRSQMAFTPATGLDLSFHDQASLIAERLRNIVRLLGCPGKRTLLHIDPELRHQLLRMVLVEVKETHRRRSQLYSSHLHHGSLHHLKLVV